MIKGVWFTQFNYVLSVLCFATYIGTICHNFYTIFKRSLNGTADGEKLICKDLFLQVAMYWITMLSIFSLAFVPEVGEEPII